MTEPGPRTKLGAFVRRWGPPVLSLGLVAFVLARIDVRAFAARLGRVNHVGFLAACAAFVLALLVADTFATALVYRRSVAPVRFRDFVLVRGASYLPSILNHHLGQAFVTLHLSRTYGVDLRRAAGATLLVYASWIGCLLVLASAVLVAQAQTAWAAIPLAIGLAYLAVLAWRPRALAETRLLAPLFEAGIAGHAVALAARLPHFAVLLAGSWLPFAFFGVDLPVVVALRGLPVLMVVSTLPLTPAGLGTRDVVAAELFERYAPGASHEERLATLAAATTSFGVALTLTELVVGLVLMRMVLARAARSPRAPAA